MADGDNLKICNGILKLAFVISTLPLLRKNIMPLMQATLSEGVGEFICSI